MSGYGLVSRVTPVHTALRNCTRDEGRSFEVGNQVLISSHRRGGSRACPILADPAHRDRRHRVYYTGICPGEVREQKVISSAGARAMVDACTAWGERNHVTVAMSELDWAGNLIESHAMEGAAANSIHTALLKPKSGLRWLRPPSERNKLVGSGAHLAPPV